MQHQHIIWHLANSIPIFLDFPLTFWYTYPSAGSPAAQFAQQKFRAANRRLSHFMDAIRATSGPYEKFSSRNCEIRIAEQSTIGHGWFFRRLVTRHSVGLSGPVSVL